ncbi:MAG: PHP domain-containing protein [Patescibacteria group bacterium]|nr:PHP domain-containing protein [Patescibacteria group bacterium]
MKCDLHCHTSYSHDSTTSPEEIVEAALKKGINCLVISDHGEIKGAQEAIEYAKDKPILIIPGIEIKSKEGDILGLNVKEIIPNKLSAEETIKKIKELGGMVIIPHPFGWFCKFKGNLKNLVSEIDGIEVLNASIFGKGNKIALDFARKHNLPLVAGSDAHFPNLVGQAYIEIPGNNLSVEEILNQIKNNKVKVGGKEAGCLEKVIDHIKRNFSKLKTLKNVRGKKRKI